MTSELEANIVAVERTKEYAEVTNEVCSAIECEYVCVVVYYL